MTVLAALEALVREVERLFPADGEAFSALAGPLDELRRMLAAAGDAPVDVGPRLDLLEDLLEARLRTRGWPAGGR